jgi:hypothetical protein
MRMQGREVRSESSQLEQAAFNLSRMQSFYFLNTHKLCHNSASISTMAVIYMKFMEMLHCGVLLYLQSFHS